MAAPRLSLYKGVCVCTRFWNLYSAHMDMSVAACPFVRVQCVQRHCVCADLVCHSSSISKGAGDSPICWLYLFGLWKPSTLLLHIHCLWYRSLLQFFFNIIIIIMKMICKIYFQHQIYLLLILIVGHLMQCICHCLLFSLCLQIT